MGRPQQVENLLVTAAEMRAIEAEEATRGNTSEVLMECAGSRVAEEVAGWLGDPTAHRVLVLAGPGNNGGDGLVVARLLAERGYAVRCLTWARRSEKDGRLRDPLKAQRVPVESIPAPFEPQELDAQLAWCTAVVDGLLGTGIQRDVEGDLASVVDRVAASHKPAIAVDIPTGIDSDTGVVRGAALPCNRTVALGAYKYGHFLQPGASYCGTITLGDIGLSEQTIRETASGELLSDALVRGLLPERPHDANKGTFGKAMIVAGSVNYIGAAVLATQGAMRSGAGLVTLACAGDLLAVMANKLTECTFVALPSDLGSISGRAIDKLKNALEGYSSLLVGSGLGTERETAHFLRGMLSAEEAETERHIGFAAVRPGHTAEEGKKEKEAVLPPLVLDGDALNILAEIEGWSQIVPEGSVLTPHPGEMARLTGSTVEEVQKDRVGMATRCASEWKQVVVLKGAGTVIAEPGGKVFVSPFANPALATAGSGDVLAGAIAGLIAQGLRPVDAACAGVYLHGVAGEMLRAEYGEAGGLAGDLPVLLARAQRRVRESR
jgi:NAD(P)H-hydrate epimerase